MKVNIEGKECIPGKSYDIYVLDDFRVRKSMLFSIRS